MTFWLANLGAYSLQLAVLVLSAVCVTALFRLRAPRASLTFWQAVLLAGAALPVLQPWSAASSTVVLTTLTFVTNAIPASPQGTSQLSGIVIAVLAGGAAVRIVWLALGVIAIRRLMARAVPLLPQPSAFAALQRALGTTAEVRLTDDVCVPATVGTRDAVVLLPPRTLRLAPAVQQAILCHELIHVRRRDWLRTLAEECWCALLWFHPAARLLATRLCLSREALVDQQAIACTQDRSAYIRALLAFAEPPSRPLPAAAQFLRRRHLSQRIALIAREVPMSRARVAAALAAASVVVTVATLSAVTRFPLAATPTVRPPVQSQEGQEEPVTPVPGDGVILPRVLREVKPEYTAAAMHAKIQGSVHLSVVVLATGDVGDIEVEQSLDTVHGLDEAAVAAASQWKFEPGRKDGKAVPVKVTLEMTFTLK